MNGKLARLCFFRGQLKRKLLYVCMYVCMYVCTQAYTHTYMYTHIHISEILQIASIVQQKIATYVHTYIHTYIQAELQIASISQRKNRIRTAESRLSKRSAAANMTGSAIRTADKKNRHEKYVCVSLCGCLYR
jgi:hypothetical protein